MEWKGMEIPCLIAGSGGVRMAEEFTIRAQIKANIIGGIQTIFAKRHPLSIGNRPGVLVTLRGALIEFMTFENNGKGWKTARTRRKVIEVGQKYEVLIFRAGARVDIYVNGINVTHPKYTTCWPGDLNSDMDVILGGQLYDKPPLAEMFNGKIYSVELHDRARLSAASPIRYPHNPFAFPLKDLDQKRKELRLPI